MVTDIDDVGGAMNRMKAANVPIVFGPGRHLPSTSIFLYFLDPDGNTTEYSFGMELFEEDLVEDAFFTADTDDHKVVVRFKFLDELLEELQVFVPLRKKLFEIKGELQLAYAKGADDGQNAKSDNG